MHTCPQFVNNVFATTDVHLFFFSPLHRDAAAEEDDVKSQLERLWQEVNSLKEMQALQTGTVLTE